MVKIIFSFVLVLVVIYSRINNSSSQAHKKNSWKFILFGKNVSLPINIGGQSPECGVKNIAKMGKGSQPDWSWDGKLITYIDKVNGSYEIYVMDSNGDSRRCVTCSGNLPLEFKKKHKGKPVFFPQNSRYLLFSVENEYGDHKFKTQPGVGDNHDLWLTNLESGDYWRLTNLPKDVAIQYPRFSSDGKKLLWSQRHQKNKGAIFNFGYEYGLWSLQLADFNLGSTKPGLSNIISFEPVGKGYYEPHGFFPGDSTKIIMTAQTNPGKSAFYLDIYTYDLVNKKLVNLVSTNDIHYEMAIYSPDAQKISYMSGPFIGFLRGPHKTDLYLMDANGQNRVRLTNFNKLGHADYIRGTVQIQKESWNPEGNQMVSAYYNHKTKENILFKINFAGSCGNK